jgi:hypothetical protein
LSEERSLSLPRSLHGKLFYSEPQKTISGCVEERNDIDPASQSTARQWQWCVMHRQPLIVDPDCRR